MSIFGSINPIESVADLTTAVGGIIQIFKPNATDVETHQFILDLNEALIKADMFKIKGSIVMSQMQVDAAQAQTNTAEAVSGSRFALDWRPALGYVLVAITVLDLFVFPLVAFGYAVSGHPLPPLPQFDTALVGELMAGMLGIGALHSFDKWSST